MILSAFLRSDFACNSKKFCGYRALVPDELREGHDFGRAAYVSEASRLKRLRLAVRLSYATDCGNKPQALKAHFWDVCTAATSELVPFPARLQIGFRID